MTVRELLVERYAVLRNLSDRSVVLFGHSVDRFKDFLGREPQLSDFDDLTVAKFLRWRATTPHKGRLPSAASVAKDKAHLSALWSFAARKRLAADMTFPDLPRLKVPKRVPRGYTAAEVALLVKQARRRVGRIGPVPAPAFWTQLLLCAWFSGERIGGLLRVRWADIDLDGRRVTFLGENRKGGIDTIVRAISPQLAEALRARQGNPAEYVWPWLVYKKPNTIFTAMRALCRQAGVTPRGFHAIRKASASYLKAGGGDPVDFLAHANPRTTKDHYLDVSITGQQSALDYLPPLDLGDDPPQKPAA